MLVAPASTVADLEVAHVGTDGLDASDAFVSEGHVCVAVVFVRTAETGGGDLDEDVVVLQVGPGTLALLDGTIFGTFENGKVDGHLGQLEVGLGY